MLTKIVRQVSLLSRVLSIYVSMQDDVDDDNRLSSVGSSVQENLRYILQIKVFDFLSCTVCYLLYDNCSCRNEDLIEGVS